MQIELHDTYGVLRIKTSEFLFDLEDLPLIKGRDSWYCDKDGYLVSSYFYNGIRRFVRFHRLVMHAKPGQMFNVGVMMPWMDYTPRTLDEIIAANSHNEAVRNK